MISKVEYRVVLDGTLVASRLGIIPADWNEEKQTLILTRCSWKRAISPALLLIHVTYLIFIGYRVLSQVRSVVGIENHLIQALFISVHVMGSVYHLHVVLYSKEIVDLFNLLGNFTSTQGTYGILICR
jgi:hypothetical protein